jgi:N-acylneuraminate cytidylyltransferase/CMP-N,N'-diacetyllegionaminic acid synthase
LINNSKILAIIPARGGSKGVPKKNIKLLLDKPLIAYTIKAAQDSKYIDRVVVSTEDKNIAEISKRYGAEIPVLRPKELSTDQSPTYEAIIHMLNELALKENYTPDIVCLLQCTSPLRNGADIDGTIERMLKTESDAAVSVCEVESNPYWSNIFEGDKLKYFIEEGRKITRRQDLPKVYRFNGAVYIIKTDVFLKEKTFEIEKLTGYVMSEENSVDIDTFLDFKIAELIMKERGKIE